MKIIIGTGGSGGHIFPALRVASQLKREGHEIFFVGVFKTFREKIAAQGYAVNEISAIGLSKKTPIVLLKFCFYMFKGIIESFRILKEIKGDAVLGFGGYGSFPVLFAACCMRFPTMIHEQNVYPGRANRLLSRMVKRIAISFAGTKKYFPSDKTVLTGCPSCFDGKEYDRNEIFKGFGLNADKYTILVLGGSQGSHRINMEFSKSISILKEALDFQFIHISGQKDFDALQNAYSQITIPYYLCSFLEEIDKAYIISHLAVSRAGAVTVAELTSFGIPAVFVPYPHAGGHQKTNASVLMDKGFAAIIEEDVLTSDKLKDAVILLKDKKIKEARTLSSAEVNANVSEYLAKEIVELKK
jgi:UDP-N-acetylglucosamine--N-acetylmuramyl-(pentapeptide) pyrophosphoryl-undecaprenol N-acetylglucosamine transferase